MYTKPVQVYTKPVYCTSVYKTSRTFVHKTSLLYKCTQNQFMIQVYAKPVHRASVHKISLLYKTSLLVNNERNVHGQTILRNVQGQNITKIRAVQTMCKMCNVCKICTKFTVQVYKKPVYYTSVHKTSLPYKCTQNLFTVQV